MSAATVPRNALVNSLPGDTLRNVRDVITFIRNFAAVNEMGSALDGTHRGMELVIGLVVDALDYELEKREARPAPSNGEGEEAAGRR